MKPIVLNARTPSKELHITVQNGFDLLDKRALSIDKVGAYMKAADAREEIVRKGEK